MAVLTTSLAALRDSFNTAFPNRHKESDGWIGNKAHQGSKSGHNPDDTPGSLPEYTDADNIAEVRAIDVDKDLNSSVTMQQVIDRMLRSPNDLKRLRYIIYNRRIWSRNTNWEPRPYTGDSTHEEHAHFSGDPDTDNSGELWSVIFWLERKLELSGFGFTAQEHADALMWHIEALINGRDTVKDGPTRGATVWVNKALKELLGRPVINDEKIEEIVQRVTETTDADIVRDALREVLLHGAIPDTDEVDETPE